jgi:hypothetical protein
MHPTVRPQAGKRIEQKWMSLLLHETGDAEDARFVCWLWATERREAGEIDANVPDKDAICRRASMDKTLANLLT